ncbi:MAG: BrnT family toxin [Gallionella sp.]
MNTNLTWHEPKRQLALADRGLDFADATYIFAQMVFEFEDTHQDYGECRMICFGYLAGRLMAVGYVKRGEIRHIFSMRKANEREITKFR